MLEAALLAAAVWAGDAAAAVPDPTGALCMAHLPGPLAFESEGKGASIVGYDDSEALGYTWYDNTTHMVGSETKAGSDGQGGFIAHVAPHASGDLLFIKAFKAVTQAQGPPGENPIQWFCNGPHTYVELEDHSPYDSIAAGATMTRTVTWYLRRLPAGTDYAVGSAALIAAAQNALGKN
jgi:hypothetical protein